MQSTAVRWRISNPLLVGNRLWSGIPRGSHFFRGGPDSKTYAPSGRIMLKSGHVEDSHWMAVRAGAGMIFQAEVAGCGMAWRNGE